jgi:hypothetical protein
LLVVRKNEMQCLPSHTTYSPVYLQHFVSATKDILLIGRHHILLPPPKYVHYQVLSLKSLHCCVEQEHVGTYKKYRWWMEIKMFLMGFVE